MISENIFMLFFLDTKQHKHYNMNINKIRKLVNNMKEYQVDVYNINTDEIIDTFIAEFQNVAELRKFMDIELHNYTESYLKLYYYFSEL